MFGFASISRTLRSRRVAIWLLVGVAAWSFLATVVPQTSADPEAAARWAQQYGPLDSLISLLGLHAAFSSPLFLAATAYLAVSTAVCAWERTRHSLRVWSRAGMITSRERDALLARPMISEQLPSGVTRDQGLAAGAQSMRALRLRVARGETVAEGQAGRWGLFGSPVFHWSLVLLILVIAGGRFARSEGLVGVPVGSSILDVSESYRVLEEGLLFAGHSGLEIAVPEMDRAYMDGDVDRGAAPTVVIREDGEDVATQLVYPNKPLKYGSMTIHVSDYGLSPTVSLETSTGELIDTTRPLFDFEEGGTRTSVQGFDITDSADQAVLTVEMGVPLDADAPSLDVVVRDSQDGDIIAERRLVVGETMDLSPGDERLRFVETGDYARLSVVHDWSVPFIYALLVIGLVGLSVAVLDPHRRVLIRVADGEDGLTLNVLIRHGRRSAIFEDRVREKLDDAICELGERGEEIR